MTAVRAMSWNVRGADRPDLDELAGRILAARPDVVCLQEIRRGQASRLARRLRWEHVWALKHSAWGPLAWRAEGMAIMSRHPLRSGRRWRLSPRAPIWSYQRRIAMAATVAHPERSFVVFNLHLASHDAPNERAIQAAESCTHVEAQRADEHRPAIVLGDLNASEEPTTLAPFAGIGLHDAWLLAGDAATRASQGHTNPSHAPSQRIDYALVPASCHVERVDVPQDTTEWQLLSDHLPVVLSFRWRNEDQTRSQ